MRRDVCAFKRGRVKIVKIVNDRDVPDRFAEKSVNQMRADITKARKLLNYNPQTKIEAGIKKFGEWIKSNQP